MDMKFFLTGVFVYFVGFLLGLHFNKSKYKDDLLKHDRAWSEIICHILVNNSNLDNGVFEAKVSNGNIHIETVKQGTIRVENAERKEANNNENEN